MRVVCLLLGMLLSLHCFAWGNSGHQVVAGIAYQHLTPKTRKAVNQLLAVSPEYFRRATTFTTAATWADWLKADGVTAYNHWHYQGLPWSADGTALPFYKQPENVVWAIQQSVRVLHNKRSSPLQKAEFLRFLIHFVGDIHQPLHCIDRVSHDFPQGDRGGSLFAIQSLYANNLHAYWDRGLGYFKQHRSRDGFNKMTKALQKEYPPRRLQQKVAITNVQTWCIESHKLAMEVAYHLPEGTMPPPGYIKKGQHVVRHQLTLAGYRLAELLNAIFDPTRTTNIAKNYLESDNIKLSKKGRSSSHQSPLD